MDNSSSSPGIVRRVTLRDVAREVGVTESTASSVLNGAKSGTRVSDATRLRLQATATRLGYRPNELARSLRRSQTRLLGFFSHFEYLSARNEFLSDLVGGVQEATVEAGYDLVMYTVPVGRSPEDTVRHLADRRVDGLLFLAPYDPELLGRVVTAGLPTIALVDPVAGAVSVTVDDAEGGRLLARHLHEKGHRSVLYRGWFKEAGSAVARRRGFHAEAARLGLTVREGRTLDLEFRASLTADESAAIEAGATAIVCWDDSAATFTCEALAAAGIAVPGALAVTGFNGIPRDFAPRHELTTIRADWREVGRRGVRHLLSVIPDTGIDPGPSGLVVPVSLIPGLTT